MFSSLPPRTPRRIVPSPPPTSILAAASTLPVHRSPAYLCDHLQWSSHRHDVESVGSLYSEQQHGREWSFGCGTCAVVLALARVRQAADLHDNTALLLSSIHDANLASECLTQASQPHNDLSCIVAASPSIDDIRASRLIDHHHHDDHRLIAPRRSSTER